MSAVLGCAPQTGWQRTDRRACAPQSPPVLCLDAAPDGPYELHLGERVLLPGECIVGPQGEGGGRVRLSLWVAGERRARPAVQVRKGERTQVHIDGEQLLVTERDRCDLRVDS